jgi:hypothetical protein
VANPEHLELLRQGVEVWNGWRAEKPSLPDPHGANLGGADLRGADLRDANFSDADLGDANLSGADLSGADLTRAYLLGAHFIGAGLRRADLSGANLSKAVLVEVDLAGAVLTGCNIYGVSAWDVKLSETTKQHDLVITAPDEPQVTVDNIEVAQFVYLLLHNEKSVTSSTRSARRVCSCSDGSPKAGSRC